MTQVIKLDLDHSKHTKKDKMKSGKQLGPKPLKNQQSKQKKQEKQPQKVVTPIKQVVQSIVVEQKKEENNKTDPLNSIKQSNKNISQNLKILLNQYNELKHNEYNLEDSSNPEKKKQIEIFLKNLQSQKRRRHKKIRQLQSLQKQKDKSLEEKKFEEQMKKMNKRKQLEQQHQKRIKQLQQQKQKREKQKLRWLEFYKNYKHTKPIYKVKEQQQIKNNMEQQKFIQQKLKSLSQKYKPFADHQLDDHQNKYKQIMKNLEKKIKHQKNLYKQSIRKKNYHLQELWKGNCHKIIQEEMQEQRRKKQEPQQRKKRIKQYQQYIREKYPPTQGEGNDNNQDKKQDDVQSQNQPARKRYKFLKGVAYGEISEKIKIAKSDNEKKELGNLYLNFLKSLPKKKEINRESSQLLVNVSQPQIKKQRQSISDIFSNKKKIRAPSIRLSCDFTKQQIQSVMQKFQNRDQRLLDQQKILKLNQSPGVESYHNKQKQLNEKLINQIQQKIKLLNQINSSTK